MSIDEILALPADQLDTKPAWDALDGMIGLISNLHSQIREWDRVLQRAESTGIPTGHPHFRLGILHLMNDSDETAGIVHLQLAYESDQKYAPNRAHRMAAYRVLSLVKDLLADLGRSKQKWQRLQLEAPYRSVLLRMIFVIYDATAQQHILDMGGHTYHPFFALIADDDLRVFAGDNYNCAQLLLEHVSTDSGRSFVVTNEYAVARAIVGLYGGVLEALLADKLPAARDRSLGQLINEAYEQGFLVLGTKLCALCTIIWYFRNYVHANRSASRTAYFVDINVAKGLKVATDAAISELLLVQRVPFTAVSEPANPPGILIDN